MKNFLRILAIACLGMLSPAAWPQAFNLFQPATGVLVGSTTTYVTTAAASSDVISLWTGTCNATTFLRADGSCQAAGSGTVTSVGLAAPNWLTVSNSPVTTSGTLTLTGVPAADANSIGLGIGALTQGGITGTNNTAVGQGNVLNGITSGSDNTAVGNQAAKTLSTGTNNTAVGSGALQALTTVSNNTAVGYHALTAATTGNQNVAVGSGALAQSTTSANNTGVGLNALAGIISGSFDNSALGKNSGSTITSGSGNIILGEDGNITSGSNNLIIGNTITTTTATVSNQLDIVDSIVATDYTKGPVKFKGGEVSTGTKFTASGCTNSATVGGATAGKFTSGTTGACTVTITMGGATGSTAPNGWTCSASDTTTPANLISQSGTISTTACTITGTTVSGDVVTFMAIGW